MMDKYIELCNEWIDIKWNEFVLGKVIEQTTG
jgi:hypothetical protein